MVAMRGERLAIIGFMGVLLFGVAARGANGAVYSGLEARNLIEALTESALYTGAAIATSSVTVLALMLTLVGLVQRMDKDFDVEMYHKIALIGRASAINLIGSVILLMMLSMPVGEYDNIPTNWYVILYNVLYFMMVFLCALSVTIVLILLDTIQHMIAKITPTDDI